MAHLELQHLSTEIGWGKLGKFVFCLGGLWVGFRLNIFRGHDKSVVSNIPSFQRPLWWAKFFEYRQHVSLLAGVSSDMIFVQQYYLHSIVVFFSVLWWFATSINVQYFHLLECWPDNDTGLFTIISCSINMISVFNFLNVMFIINTGILQHPWSIY